jgi:hypothetical protein
MNEPSQAEMNAAFEAALSADAPLPPPLRPCTYPRLMEVPFLSRFGFRFVAEHCDRPMGHPGQHAIHWRRL